MAGVTNHPVERKFTLGASGGVYTTPKNSGLVGAKGTIDIGGELRKNNTYAGAKVGLGTSTVATAYVGHEFPIGEHNSIDVSGNTEYIRDNINSTNNHITNIYDNTNNETYKVGDKVKYKKGREKAGISAMFNFKGKAGKLGLGVEAGYMENQQVKYSQKINLSNFQENQNAQINVTTVDGGYSGGYFTPKIKGELNLDKKGAWQLTADADIYGGNAGIRYTF